MVNKVTVSLAYKSLLFTSLPIFFQALSAQTCHDDKPDPNLHDEFDIDSHKCRQLGW